MERPALGRSSKTSPHHSLGGGREQMQVWMWQLLWSEQDPLGLGWPQLQDLIRWRWPLARQQAGKSWLQDGRITGQNHTLPKASAQAPELVSGHSDPRSMRAGPQTVSRSGFPEGTSSELRAGIQRISRLQGGACWLMAPVCSTERKVQQVGCMWVGEGAWLGGMGRFERWNSTRAPAGAKLGCVCAGKGASQGWSHAEQRVGAQGLVCRKQVQKF